MSTIDLEHGDPEPEETPRQRRRRERAASDSSSSSSGGSRRNKGVGDTDDTGLASRLDVALNKLADQMDARDDEELATALREERRGMTQGLVSLTGTVPILRIPLLLLLAFAEPVLAFWRVGRILFYRFLSWRERRIIAAQQAQEEMQVAEWEASQQPGMPVQ